jgi:hypothetical protein
MPLASEQLVEQITRDAREWRLNKREYMLLDPCFNQPLAWSKQVLEAIIRAGVRFRFAAIVEPTGDIDREWCRLMVRAGSTLVTGLVGSCHDEVLAQANRPFNAADVAHAYELFEQENVLYMPQLMFGGPGETDQTIEATLRFVRRFRPIMLQSGVGVRVYPQAPLRARAVAEGIVPADDDLLEPRFYLAPGLDENKVAQRLQTLQPSRLGAAVKWCRYFGRLLS